MYSPSRISIKVLGSREWATGLWAMGLFGGGLFFLFTGYSSYSGQTNMAYIPQGIFLMFYGTLAVTLSLFLLSTAVWDVGSGTCSIDKTRDLCRIIRLNFPGSYRMFEMTFPASRVRGVSLEWRSGLFPRRMLGLTIGGVSQLPLNYNQELVKISTLETLALALAKWLGVGLEWRDDT